jgi:hypothetical protein
MMNSLHNLKKNMAETNHHERLFWFFLFLLKIRREL